MHEHGQPGAGSQKDGFVAVVVQQLVQGVGLADDRVQPHLDAQAAHVIDLGVDDALGQPELGDAIDQHAAGGVERFKDGDTVPEARQVAGAGQPRGAAADDGHLLSAGRRQLRRGRGVGQVPVGHVALQPPDGHRLALLAQHAQRLALGLLGADAAADGGQVVVGLEGAGRARHVALLQALDKGRDVDAHRTALDAFGPLALQAAHRL